VQMVEPDQNAVEAALVAGRLVCDCGGELRPWAHARWRTLRNVTEWVRLRPRRARCTSCLATHVLLPTTLLLRRRDLAAVIGEALWSRHLDGASLATVAGWFRSFARRAEDIRETFTALAHRYDPQLAPIEARGSPCAEALEAIGVAAAAAVRFLGPAPLWDFVAGASGGRLLTNTIYPLPRPA
jgi:hypothetical protein